MNKIVTKKYRLGRQVIWIQTKKEGKAVAIRQVLTDVFGFPSEVSQWENYFPRRRETSTLDNYILARVDYSRTKWFSVNHVGEKMVEGVSPPFITDDEPKVLTFNRVSPLR